MNFVCFILLVTFFCVAESLPRPGKKTENCKDHRQRELNSGTKANLAPKCDEKGNYEPLQCLQDSGLSMCLTEDGSQITELSKNTKTCDCHLHRHKAVKKAELGYIGHFIPACEENGTYSRQQCHGS
ncbi:U24-ctenitoxin-Pn1a, partial [Stegodyphus mimosarum]